MSSVNYSHLLQAAIAQRTMLMISRAGHRQLIRWLWRRG